MEAVKEHWETVYSTRGERRVSWFEEHASTSMALIERAGVPIDGPIIDVGGGASHLVDDLLDRGYRDLTVLDLSGAALALARARLGERADRVEWIEADITEVDLQPARYALWHDRAVFHFLTAEDDRRRYVRRVVSSVRPGGAVIVATFALDGPTRCSGLDVARYSHETLHGEFGDAFELIDHLETPHETPFGTVQQFVYCCCRRP